MKTIVAGFHEKEEAKVFEILAKIHNIEFPVS